MRKITHVIFDVDGLLVDTEGLFNEVIQEYALEMTGRRIPEDAFRELRIKMFGRKREESASFLHEELGLGAAVPPSDYLEWRKPRLEPRFRKVDLLPGAAALVSRLAQRSVPMALASGSSREDVDLKFTGHPDVRKPFGTFVVTGDQVAHGKPDPELFLKAGALLKADPAHTLVFEDAGNGVEAAKAAGMYVVAVPHPWLSPEAVQDADEVLSSLSEFRPEEWGL